MNKQLLLTALLAMTVILSVSAISASEINVTDSYTTNLVDDTSDVSVPMESTTDSSVLSVSSDSNVDNDSSKVSLSSEEVLESENSNTLSTNLDENNVSSDGKGATHFAAYSDDAKVGASTIDVSKTITSKDITKYYRGSAPYTATFLDINGNVLKNTDVKLTINGKTYTVKTDSKGVASLAINLYPNTYKMTAVNPKTGYSLTNTIKVLSTIQSSDLTKVYKDSKMFSVTFLNSEGKALANQNIKFTVNGKTYTQKTDSKGVGSLPIGLYAGTYKMTSTNVDGLSNTNTIKVLSSTTTKITASDYTFKTTDTKTIKVTLNNGLGYALDSGKTVTFKVNGKTYTAKTNSNGVASLNLPSLSAGTYTVSYSFAGDNTYGSSSASSKVKIVANTKTPTLTVKSTTTFGRG
ncbi:Ig-like domain-containing protein, partial [Methanobrevibacter sp.]|uniref:Ig-like domain-containing protein n=1 Tax=Methanobrevibacter sp. TaxID=66852 RepID=UPI00388E7DDC